MTWPLIGNRRHLHICDAIHIEIQMQDAGGPHSRDDR